MTYLRVLIANIAYNTYGGFAIAQDAGLCKLKTYHIIRSDNHEIAGSSYNFFIILRKFIFMGYLVTCECQHTFEQFGKCSEVFYAWTVSWFILKKSLRNWHIQYTLNSLTLMSDQERISPYNVNTISTR